MKKIAFTFLTFFAALILSNGAEAQLVIDDFNSGNSTSQVGIGMATSSTTGSDILGGQRTDSVEVPNLSGDEFFGAVSFSNGNLVVAQGSLDEIVGAVRYNSLGGVDLTGDGAFQNFLFDFTALDSPLPIADALNLSVTSGNTTFSQDITIPGMFSLGEVLVDFSDFDSVDLTSVDSIELEFDFADQPGRDFQLGSFAVVSSIPEPGSLTILSIALPAMLLRRRRK